MARVAFSARIGTFLIPPGPCLGPIQPDFHVAAEVQRGISHSRLPSTLVNIVLILISTLSIFLHSVMFGHGNFTTPVINWQLGPKFQYTDTKSRHCTRHHLLCCNSMVMELEVRRPLTRTVSTGHLQLLSLLSPLLSS
jgi:hypothetical protein